MRALPALARSPRSLAPRLAPVVVPLQLLAGGFGWLGGGAGAVFSPNLLSPGWLATYIKYYDDISWPAWLCASCVARVLKKVFAQVEKSKQHYLFMLLLDDL